VGEDVALQRFTAPALGAPCYGDQPISEGVTLDRFHDTETIVSLTSVRKGAFLT
jgi:hypothetical protein